MDLNHRRERRYTVRGWSAGQCLCVMRTMGCYDNILEFSLLLCLYL